MHLRVLIRWPLTFIPFLRRRAREPLVRRFPFPLILQKNITPRGYPSLSLSSSSPIAISRPEHENNEPALGVAGLVDRCGWKDINDISERKIKGMEGREGKGEARNGRRIVRESSGEASKKRNRHVGCFATNVSRRFVAVDPCTRCPLFPPAKRVNGEGLVDVEDAMTTLFACYRAAAMRQRQANLRATNKTLSEDIMGSIPCTTKMRSRIRPGHFCTWIGFPSPA